MVEVEPVRRSCEASIDIGAPARAVWDVVADVTRVGEWSGECRGCVWMGAAAAPAAGVRFRGRNRRGGFRWSRVNEFVEVDEPRTLVWRTLRRFPYADTVEWRLALADGGASTRVTESFTVLRVPRVMELVLGLALPAHRDRSQDLADDLGRLRRVVESPSA